MQLQRYKYINMVQVKKNQQRYNELKYKVKESKNKNKVILSLKKIIVGYQTG
jgi:ribosomal protein S8